MNKLKYATVGGMFVLSMLAVPSSASADGPECDFYNHCYGIQHYLNNGTRVDAVAADLWTDCLHVDNPAGNNPPGSNPDVATHEVWVHTDDGNPSTITWVEGGYVRGLTFDGNTQFRWLWAEYTGSAFYAHYIMNASVSGWKQIFFYKNASSKWEVYVDGPWRGTATHTSTFSGYYQAGAETTEPKVYDHGKMRNMQHHVVAGNWVAGSSFAAGATTGVYSINSNANSHEHWSLQNMCPGVNPPTGGFRVKSEIPSEKNVKDVVAQMAVQYGERSPKGFRSTKASRNTAFTLMADGTSSNLDTDQDVYVVEMTGNFTAPTRPEGVKPVKGDTLTVMVDVKTGEVTDSALTYGKKDLSKLGSVKVLK